MGDPTSAVGRVIRGRALPWTLAVLGLVASVALGWLWRGERALTERREEVAAAAAAFLEALTNFSAETIEEDVADIRSYAVAGFADEVEETFGRRQVEALREAGARSSGDVRSVAVQVLEGATATVFAVVDQTITGEEGTRGEVLRVELGMIETADGWKVERVDILQTPS